jgi:hypothetical protein
MSWFDITVAVATIGVTGFCIAIYAAFDIARNEGSYKQNIPDDLDKGDDA